MKILKKTYETNNRMQGMSSIFYMEWKHGNEMKNHHCVLTVRRNDQHLKIRDVNHNC